MELELLRKLREAAEEVEGETSAMPETTQHDRNKKALKSMYVDGFCAAVEMLEEIVSENHEQMARDYGQEATSGRD